jgi:hypothetical protein
MNRQFAVFVKGGASPGIATIHVVLEVPASTLTTDKENGDKDMPVPS